MPACSDARFGFSAFCPLPLASGSLTQLHVRAISPVHHVDVLAGRRIDAKRSRTFRLRAHQFERLVDRQIRRRHVLGQRRRAPGPTFGNLHERTEASDANANQFPALGIGAEIEHRVVGLLGAVLDGGQQTTMLAIAVVELSQERDRFALAARDLVEIVFHLRGEVAFDEVAEVFAQQLGHGKRREARNERLPLPEHVATADDRRDGRRVGRRTTDAEPFELLDERRFREPRRRNGFVPLRLGADERDRRRTVAMNAVADAALREDRFLFLELRRRIVAAFDVGATEAGKLDRLSARREHRRLARRDPCAEISRLVRSTRASTICDAIVRFQISS